MDGLNLFVLSFSVLLSLTGETPLTCAISRQNAYLVCYFLDHGADTEKLNSKNGQWVISLVFCLAVGCSSTCDELIQHVDFESIRLIGVEMNLNQE